MSKRNRWCGFRGSGLTTRRIRCLGDIRERFLCIRNLHIPDSRHPARGGIMAFEHRFVKYAGPEAWESAGQYCLTEMRLSKVSDARLGSLCQIGT